jgi:hypothetical protein
MIKHIVLWRLKDNAHGNTKNQNAAIIKEKLESLRAKIPEIIKMEVGIDFSLTDDSVDIVLYSEFATIRDLNIYQTHPEHKKIMPYISESRSERRMADYEIK